ncbi:uncharacterized protein [Rutidosis leptorrhynchoides]|uniref:uncharacterized protein n=1 Tax=Rutidosis leptorrhynchoides TaxID=125765 RepID=UPI003A996010
MYTNGSFQHIGAEAEGYEGAYGGFGFGPRNEEGCSILDFAIAHEMVVANSFFKKRDAQLATFHSGGRITQIDFLLLRKGELRTCRDCKNLHGANAETFRETVADRLRVEGDYVAPTDVDQIWNSMASTIRDVAKETLGVAIGTSRAHKSSRESWKLNSKEGANDIYRIAKARERRSRDLVNVKFIKDEAGQSIVKEDLIRNRWEEYFASLFGRERPEWNGELHEVREYQNNCFCTKLDRLYERWGETKQ